MKLAYDPRILAHFTEGVLWAALGKAPAIEAILADWADTFGLDVSHFAEPTDRAKAIKNAVGVRSILFIIDDVWDEAAANVLRCGGPNCAHLLTTRDDGIARAFAGPVATEKVPELEPALAFELLQSLAPEVCAVEPEAARGLLDAVGGLPLAIELLGGYLGDPAHSGLAALRYRALHEMSDPLRRLQLARDRLGGSPSERPTLEQTIAFSLEDLTPEVVKAFYALGAFAPKPDSFELAAAEVVAETGAACFGVLLKRNLIESPDGERLAIHPVMYEYARTHMPPGAVLRHRQAYVALVVSAQDDWRRIESEYAQVRHLWSVWDADATDKIQFVYRVHKFQRLRGLWRDSRVWVEDALEVARRAELKGDVATLLSNLGLISDDLGEQQKALEYYEESLLLREEVGERHELAVTLTNIGSFYNRKGEQDKALAYFERAQSIWEEVPDLYGLARTLGNIGLAYDDLGQMTVALKYYERALPIMKEIGDHAGLATTFNNIGHLYHAARQLDTAVEYYTRALAISHEVGDRASEAATRFNLGMIFWRKGQLAAAAEQLRQCVEFDESVQHPDLEKDRVVLRQVEAELAARAATDDASDSSG